MEIAEQLEALKLGPEVDRQRLSETGQEVGRPKARNDDAGPVQPCAFG